MIKDLISDDWMIRTTLTSPHKGICDLWYGKVQEVSVRKSILEIVKVLNSTGVEKYSNSLTRLSICDKQSI